MFKLFAIILALGQDPATPIEYQHKDTFPTKALCEEQARASAPDLERYFVESYGAHRDQDYKLTFECRPVEKDS